YQPVEFTSVMFRPLRPDLPLTGAHPKKIQVRLLQGEEHELWAQTAARGTAEFSEVADQILELMRISAQRPRALAFLAEFDGCAIAQGVLSMCEGVALLGGASTIPEARRQGAHRALLYSRLHYAAEHGCDVAMISAQPAGGASQRNAERLGF